MLSLLQVARRKYNTTFSYCYSLHLINNKMQVARNSTSHQQRKQKLVFVNNDPNTVYGLQLTTRSDFGPTQWSVPTFTHTSIVSVNWCQTLCTSSRTLSRTWYTLMYCTPRHVQTLSETKTAVAHCRLAAFVLANAPTTQVFAVVTSISTSFRHPSILQKSISINKQ